MSIAIRLAPAALAGVLAWTYPAAAQPPAQSPAPRGITVENFDPRAEQERALKALKTDLKLNAAQETAWDRFAEAMRPPQGPGFGPADRQPSDGSLPPRYTGGAQPTLDQRLDHGLEIVERSAVEARSRVAAIKIFYRQLTPDQQRVFDGGFDIHLGPPPELLDDALGSSHGRPPGNARD